jgi:hypothetical protein
VQLVVHVDVDALPADSQTGQAVLGGGVRVSAETSRRLACDATRVAITHDRARRVLDVGRSRRTIPVAIRRALEERDRGCRFPGCTNRLTDAHHVQHWADGGATRLDNLLLLCRRHHRLVHEGGYGVVRTAGGAFAVSDPAGQLVADVPPLSPPPPQPGVDVPGAVWARRFTFTNYSRINIPQPPHERLDLAWAMRTVYRPPHSDMVE